MVTFTRKEETLCNVMDLARNGSIFGRLTVCRVVVDELL